MQSFVVETGRSRAGPRLRVRSLSGPPHRHHGRRHRNLRRLRKDKAPIGLKLE